MSDDPETRHLLEQILVELQRIRLDHDPSINHASTDLDDVRRAIEEVRQEIEELGKTLTGGSYTTAKDLADVCSTLEQLGERDT